MTDWQPDLIRARVRDHRETGEHRGLRRSVQMRQGTGEAGLPQRAHRGRAARFPAEVERPKRRLGQDLRVGAVVDQRGRHGHDRDLVGGQVAGERVGREQHVPVDDVHARTVQQRCPQFEGRQVGADPARLGDSVIR